MPVKKTRFKKRFQVALLLETSNAYCRGLLAGINGYLRENEPWSIFLGEYSRGQARPSWIRNWQGDGIIARIENEATAKAVAASHLPAVDVSAARLLPELCWVETDDIAIATLALDHLQGCGFTHLGFCGANFNWSRWRCEQFTSLAKQRGLDCHVYKPRYKIKQPSWESEQNNLGRWLTSLPKPIGIMAAYDIRGQQLIEACRRQGMLIPEEIAVIGVDNDTLLCEMCDPPLSSVIPDTYRTGYQAAETLVRLMTGHKPKQNTTLVKPLGIAKRRSTDICAITDPEIAKAMHYIQQHSCDGIQVVDVLRTMSISRRIFERRFLQVVGHSPHEEIQRVRIGRIKMLLRETDLSLAEIAKRTGFEYDNYLSYNFKRRTGLTPNQFRKQHHKQ